MKRLYYAILFISISFFTFNCQREVSYSGPGVPGTGNNNTQPVTATLQGNVVDENGQPAAGVTVKVGAKTTTTNTRGYFRIHDASLDKNTSLVTAEKTGYFKSLRSFRATSGTNHVMIKLTKKEVAGTVNATTGGTVTLANGAKVALPANGVVKASGGSAYTGTVNIYASYIDPTGDDIAQTVPGSFMADDKNNNRVTLASYGMLAVELETAGGEKLQIAQGSTATLTTPIPSTLQSSAPATIALWYVDEQTGVWKEEGSAAKNGTSYTGEVKHFSFWNCDIGIPAINLTLTLKNVHGTPIVHGLVRISRTGTGWLSYASGWTDSLGQVSGLVPANESLLLEVLDPCNNVVYSQNIGPYTQHTNLGVITVSGGNSSSFVTIEGRLKNCTNANVTDGFAIINYDNVTRYASVDNNGEFTVSFLRCAGSSASCEITGIDEAAHQQGSAVSVTVTSPVTSAGDISACGISTNQYINYTLDGANYSISSMTANDSLTSYTYQTQTTLPLSTWMSGFRMSGTDQVYMNFSHNTTTGTYPVTMFGAQNFDSTTIVQPFNVTLTSYPATAGGFFEGTFSGQFKNISNPVPVHTVSGSFRIRRMN